MELIARIPPALKVRGRQPKRLLREVAGPLLPESVRARRDKSPFPIPVAQWFGGELAPVVRSILQSPRCLDRGVFRPDELRQRSLPAGLAWPLVNLELWFRIFMDGDRPPGASAVPHHGVNKQQPAAVVGV